MILRQIVQRLVLGLGLLAAGTGPLQIVVPHEQRAGRWIRQVNRLEIRQAT